MQPKILISACLLGAPVRYDGVSQAVTHPLLLRLQQEGRLVPFCPEVAGGLPVPRVAAELQADGRVLTRDGGDVSGAFAQGAREAVLLARVEGVCCALLKARSPSCGVGQIYDGHFSGRLQPGDGLTAQALQQAGIPLFTEADLEALAHFLEV